MLLLRHALATLLDDRTHAEPLRGRAKVSGKATRAGATTEWPTARPSASFDEAVLEVLVDGLLRHPERPADPDRRQRPAVHQAVDRHLRHAHERRHLGDSQKPELSQRTLTITGRWA